MLKGIYKLFKNYSIEYLIINYRSKCKKLINQPIDYDTVFEHEYFKHVFCSYRDQLKNADEHKLLQQAEEILSLPKICITDKETSLNIDNLQEYVSFAPYFWNEENSNPLNKSNSKPSYKDGRSNPFLAERSDKPKLAQVCARTHLLAIAFMKTNDVRYLDYLEEQITIWFCDEDNRMLPSMNRAQIKPWIGKKQGRGIIDSRWLILLFDALVIVKYTHGLNEQLQKNLAHWFLDFADWILSSFSGFTETGRKNNRGTWVDVVLCYIALMLNKESVAKIVIDFSMNKRPKQQIDDTGLQPFELMRYTAVSYSLYNMFPLLYLAEIQNHVFRQQTGWQELEKLKKSTNQLSGLIKTHEKGKIESIDFESSYNLNLYYPYSFEQLNTFPCLRPYT